MIQENTPEIRVIETELIEKVSNLRSLLFNHISNLTTIKRSYEDTCRKAKEKYETDNATAKRTFETSSAGAESNYQKARSETIGKYANEKNTAEENFNRTKKTYDTENRSLSERNQSRINELRSLEGAWRTYIDSVHADFDKAIEQFKKKRTDAIRAEYENLNKRKNQSSLGEKGNVPYKHENPFVVALSHPYTVIPEWANYARNMMLALAIAWILVLVGMCIWNAFHYLDIAEVMASGLVRYGLYAILGYLVLEYVFSFIATYEDTSKQNNAEKSRVESANDRILNDKADAAKSLSVFTQKYKSVYWVNGRWDFDWRRYPCCEYEADSILRDTVAVNSAIKPKSCEGIQPYVFEINYNALNTLS